MWPAAPAGVWKRISLGVRCRGSCRIRGGGAKGDPTGEVVTEQAHGAERGFAG